MSVSASAKSVRISPRKAGVVAALVRGQTVADALVILEHTPRKAAGFIRKVLLSAQANAAHTHNLKEESLTITSITIGRGPAMKRFRPAAFGRALPYKHETSHINVIVDGDPRPPAKRKAASKPAAAKSTDKTKVTAKEKK
jgi:large subunit ribosomal protein L22